MCTIAPPRHDCFSTKVPLVHGGRCRGWCACTATTWRTSRRPARGDIVALFGIECSTGDTFTDGSVRSVHQRPFAAAYCWCVCLLGDGYALKRGACSYGATCLMALQTPLQCWPLLCGKFDYMCFGSRVRMNMKLANWRRLLALAWHSLLAHGVWRLSQSAFPTCRCAPCMP